MSSYKYWLFIALSDAFAKAIHDYNCVICFQSESATERKTSAINKWFTCHPRIIQETRNPYWLVNSDPIIIDDIIYICVLNMYVFYVCVCVKCMLYIYRIYIYTVYIYIPYIYIYIYIYIPYICVLYIYMCVCYMLCIYIYIYIYIYTYIYIYIYIYIHIYILYIDINYILGAINPEEMINQQLSLSTHQLRPVEPQPWQWLRRTWPGAGNVGGRWTSQRDSLSGSQRIGVQFTAEILEITADVAKMASRVASWVWRKKKRKE